MSEKTYYAPYIDGLRAIAVLSVIVYHLHAGWLPGGFAGVDVFFVISGFVVSASVHRMQPAGVLPFMAYFYARRVTRIVPALFVCLVATALAATLFVPNDYLSLPNQRTGMAAFFGLSNFILARSSDGYFAPITELNPYTHTWSLGVEEQFYFLFPLAFFGWLAGRRRAAVALFAAGMIVSLAISMWLAHANPIHAFYMIWSRFWELAAGVLLFQCMKLRGHSFERPSAPSRWANLGGLASIGVLFAGLWLADAAHAPMPASLLPVLGTVGALGFLHGRSGGVVEACLSHPAMRFVGRISYSLYLWHWPVFVLFRWTVGLTAPANQLMAVALTLLLSMLSYRFVETPARRSGARLPRLVAIGAGAALALTGVSAMLLFDKSQSIISLSTVARHPQDWYAHWEDVNAEAGDDECRAKVERDLIAKGTRWQLSRGGCPTATTASHKLYVVGDSHAQAYMPLMARYTKTTGVPVELFTLPGCAVVSTPLGIERSVCTRFLDAVSAELTASLKPGDVVFLPGLRLPRLTELTTDFDEARVQRAVWGDKAVRDRAASEAAAAPFLRRLSDKGAIIVLEAPKPILKLLPYRCSDWFDRSNPSCAPGPLVDRAYIEKLREPVMQSFERLQASNPAIRVWDPLPVLCPQAACSATSAEGQPLFFDSDHLSGHGNTVLLPDFARFLQGVFGGAPKA